MKQGCLVNLQCWFLDHFRIADHPRSGLTRYCEWNVALSSHSGFAKRTRPQNIRHNPIGSQQNGPEYLYEALDFVAQGKVKTIVETYPLADAPKAYQRVVEGKARFRAVLTM